MKIKRFFISRTKIREEVERKMQTNAFYVYIIVSGSRIQATKIT